MSRSGGRDVQLTSLGSTGEMEELRLLLDSQQQQQQEQEEEEEEEEEGRRKKVVQVRVTGMTCAACSNSVESAVLRLPGVISASVALLHHRADVVFNPSFLKDDDIKNAIEDAGFEAEILPDPSTSNSKSSKKTLVGQFTIGGMTCAACVNSIEGILRGLPGVKRAVVALATSLGEVEYDPSVITKDEIVTAIEDAGFEGSLVQSSQQDRITLFVTGVFGELDALFLEGILNRMRGVRQFRYNRVSGELEVLFDPEVVASRTLVDGIEQESNGKLIF